MEERFPLISPRYRDVAPGLAVLDRQNQEVDFEKTFPLTRHWPNTKVEVTDGLGHNRILSDVSVISMSVEYLSNSRVPAQLSPSKAIQNAGMESR